MIVSAGQTVIPLPVPPAVPSSVRLSVDGSIYAAPDAPMDATEATWTCPCPILEPTDAVPPSYV